MGEKVHNTSTDKWARESGFSPEEAKIIGIACNGVDFTLETSPFNFLSTDATSWHFNINDEGNDSRLEHFFEMYELAIYLYYGEGNKEAGLEALGKGLHAYQDYYSHMDWDPLVGNISARPHIAYEKVDGYVYSFAGSIDLFDHPEYDLIFEYTDMVDMSYYTGVKTIYKDYVYVASKGDTRITKTANTTRYIFKAFLKYDY